MNQKNPKGPAMSKKYKDIKAAALKKIRSRGTATVASLSEALEAPLSPFVYEASEA